MCITLASNYRILSLFSLVGLPVGWNCRGGESEGRTNAPGGEILQGRPLNLSRHAVFAEVIERQTVLVELHGNVFNGFRLL